MPSKAWESFDQNAQDIERLLELHQEKGGTSPGRRRGLEVLNKSAIVLITSYWGAYCEDIATEGLEHIAQHGSSPDQLRKEIKQIIAKELKADPNVLSVWSLCGEGWKKILKTRLDNLRDQRNRKLNTPRTQNIDDLFLQALVLSSISSSWKWSKKMTIDRARNKLDKYVTLRGEIAHRGIAANGIKRLVSKTGGAVNSHVKKVTGKPLWELLRRRQRSI